MLEGLLELQPTICAALLATEVWRDAKELDFYWNTPFCAEDVATVLGTVADNTLLCCIFMF